jgi:hypothetical protein
VRTYILITGIIFGLIVVAHVWRAAVEAPHFDAEFVVLTMIAAALCGWAVRLLLRRPRTP